MQPRIREFERADVPELIQLCREHAAFERAPWTERNRQADLENLFLNSESARCWVVDGERELAGFATATLERTTWDAGHFMHMDCIFLRETYRGSGLGRALMQCVMEAALALGALNLQWQTPQWNESAIRFYDRLGGNSTTKQRFTMSPSECADAVRAWGPHVD